MKIPPADAEKDAVQTVESVTRPHYYEKDGLRTYGDDKDHDHETPITFKKVMALIGMAFVWTGSQIPVYIFGGIPPYIYRDIGGADRWTWFVLGNLLTLAAICPFVGSLSDLMGRRYVALLGMGFIMLGMVVASTAHTMNTFIGGMVIAGVGEGIGELTALAATSEMVPTRKRGKYVAGLIFTIVPFCPSVLWGQLIASKGMGAWRWCGLLCGLYNLVGFLLILFFYFPPPRVNAQGLTRSQILRQIDFVGGFLSIAGTILFLAGLQWGGYQYGWKTAHVLVPLFLGAMLLIAFCFWEKYGAKHPMFPARLKQAPRVLTLTLVITFISGSNFFSIVMFWPTQAFNVYGQDPVGVGIRGLPVGFGIMAGAAICLVLLTVLRGHNRELMIASSILMTAGTGSLAVATPYNLHTLWGLLTIAGLGIGGIVVPASIITTIICPDDLIATVTAITLAIRVIGGAVGYTVYYNVLINKFVPKATELIGGSMVKMGITNATYIGEAIVLTGASMIQELQLIPGISGNQTRYEILVAAGQLAYAESYKFVYLASIAFGCVSIIASCFLGDISEYMDNHVAVVLH